MHEKQNKMNICCFRRYSDFVVLSNGVRFANFVWKSSFFEPRSLTSFGKPSPPYALCFMAHKGRRNILNLISDNKMWCFVSSCHKLPFKAEETNMPSELCRWWGERLQITCLAFFSSNTEAYNIFSRFSLFCYFFLVYWLNIQHYASALFTPLVNNITSSSFSYCFPQISFFFVCTYRVIIKFNKKYSFFLFYCLSYQRFSFCGELIVSCESLCRS